jgi:glycosyltransferase involved in cell wall biosynthesis
MSDRGMFSARNHEDPVKSTSNQSDSRGRLRARSSPMIQARLAPAAPSERIQQAEGRRISRYVRLCDMRCFCRPGPHFDESEEKLLTVPRKKHFKETEAAGAIDNPALPGIAFALRFGNEDGFVQRFFAQQRDLVARELRGEARCFLVFTEIGDRPVYEPTWAVQAQANFYDYSHNNKRRLAEFVSRNSIKLVVLQGASFGEIDIRFLHELGALTLNTEDSSFDHERTQWFAITIAKFIERRLMKLNVHDLHIANTKGQYDFLRQFAQLSPRRLHIVPYGIDTEFYSPGNGRAACAKLGLDPETLWIMAAAQARPEKRVDLIMKSIARVKEHRPLMPIGFFYVGGGLLLAEWQELARNLPSSIDYQFFGKQLDLRTFYRAASIFVHGASRESFGLVLAEAMASGLPVVATRAHGPAEIVESGRTGFLVERDDWDGFVAAVLRYIDDPQLRRSHGASGRARVLERYAGEREAAELATLMRLIVSKS